MKIKTVAGTRTEPEPVRSTAYYYGDLERLKRQDTPKHVIENSLRPETVKEKYRETVKHEGEDLESSSLESCDEKIFGNKDIEQNDLENLQDATVLEVRELDDYTEKSDYGKISSKNSLRKIKTHDNKNGLGKSSKIRAKCDLHISQKDSLSEHLKRIEAIQNRNDAAIDHIKWRSEDVTDNCVSLTDHLIWRTDTKLSDSWRADNVNLSLTENLKWRTDSIDKKVTCPSLSENLKWNKDLGSIDPVLSLNERLKWKKLYEQDVKDFADWKEKVKYKDAKIKRNIETNNEKQNESNAVSEYVESNEIIKAVPNKEIQAVFLYLRDRKLSPEFIYSTPENHRYFSDRKYHQDLSVRSPSLTSPESSRRIFGETYSTAGTFPMPETKEKEPLLAELEVVGRVPLSQLDSHSTVRRSRSWYLCCPNVPDEEVSRESSWRYSSLRPVTVTAPAPGQNGLRLAAHSTSSDQPEHPEDIRVERDSLLRALGAERQRAAAAARAHDARLAELHGVIAELVRRRGAERRAIEEESDECDSTTQPAGELDNDGDQSKTDQNDASSMLSPDIVNAGELPSDTQEPDTKHDRCDLPCVGAPCMDPCDPHNQSDKDSELCLSTARCCESSRHGHTASAASCDREHGSVTLHPVSPGRCESRQAKMASRVRLRKTGDTNQLDDTQSWCLESAERLSLDVCAQAGYREALVAAQNDGASSSASMWRGRCARLQADCNVLQCALQRATDTAHKLSSACAVQESACVMVCSALKAADRALEAYDVLLALAETKDNTQQREAAEKVANQLLSRLEGEQNGATAIGEPLLSPGPWMQHLQVEVTSPWTEDKESALRAHAARLKAATVTLRETKPPPKLFSYHDSSDSEQRSPSAIDMERAVTLQETLALSERGAHKHKNVTKERRESERHWLDAASETDL